MKKNNLGFTLIELLAVIVILSVLMLIAVPGILKIMGDTKKDAFVSQAQSIYKSAEQAYVMSQTRGENITEFCSGTCTTPTNCGKLEISGSEGINYYVSFIASKDIVKTIKIADGTNYYYLSDTTNGVKISNITKTNLKPIDADNGKKITFSCGDAENLAA